LNNGKPYHTNSIGKSSSLRFTKHFKHKVKINAEPVELTLRQNFAGQQQQ
jgi:hypothetical protein